MHYMSHFFILFQRWYLHFSECYKAHKKNRRTSLLDLNVLIMPCLPIKNSIQRFIEVLPACNLEFVVTC